MSVTTTRRETFPPGSSVLCGAEQNQTVSPVCYVTGAGDQTSIYRTGLLTKGVNTRNVLKLRKNFKSGNEDTCLVVEGCFLLAISFIECSHSVTLIGQRMNETYPSVG